MTSTMQSSADALNVKKNVSENPMKRTIAKLRHPARAQLSPTAAEKTFDSSIDEEEDAHVTTGEFTTSATHALTKQIGQYLVSPEGDATLRKVIASLLTIDELQDTARMAGQELVLGVSDGLEEKFGTQLEKLPKVITSSILPVAAVFVGLLMLGLLLALWRFALFGLHN